MKNLGAGLCASPQAFSVKPSKAFAEMVKTEQAKWAVENRSFSAELWLSTSNHVPHCVVSLNGWSRSEYLSSLFNINEHGVGWDD